MEEYDPNFKPVAAGTQNLDANTLQTPPGVAPQGAQVPQGNPAAEVLSPPGGQVGTPPPAIP